MTFYDWTSAAVVGILVSAILHGAWNLVQIFRILRRRR